MSDLLFTLKITGVTIGGTIFVDLWDYPWWKPWKDDQWKKSSGRLDGITATEGDYGRIHSILKLDDLARLEGWQEPAQRGNKGPGLSLGTRGGVVEWEVIYVP